MHQAEFNGDFEAVVTAKGSSKWTPFSALSPKPSPSTRSATNHHCVSGRLQESLLLDCLKGTHRQSTEFGSNRRVIHKKMPMADPEQATNALAVANRELALNRPKSALEKYTNILTLLLPGHPIAFLNRCLCYLVLGFPNLAAFDAYRAIIAVRNLPGVREQLFNFARYAEEANSQVDIWVTDPFCYVGQGRFPLLTVELASITPMGYERVKVESTVDGTAAVAYHMKNDILLGAHYRLALSLWKCGGGAWQSAMDIICRATELRCFHEMDKEALTNLHSQILFGIEGVMTEEVALQTSIAAAKSFNSAEAPGLTGWAALSPQSQKDSGIRGLLKSTFTTMTREQYPWDRYSPVSSTHRSASRYPVHAHDPWGIPAPKAVDNIDKKVQKLVAGFLRLRDPSFHPLAAPIIRNLRGYLARPRVLPEEGPLDTNWDGQSSGACLGNPNQMTPPILAPWSFRTNVLLPIATLGTLGAEESELRGLEAMLDVRRWDGWMLETLRAKVEAAVWIGSK
ncbi:hypothetical protein BCR34DRAFT_589423 [Clohesyomyces aquaticus]|uniref:Uncharacterized protein n=1 Tax=Clohesyomyces aquaticus TaxID=1231657 RepID=A0A1Y1ZGI9_9PLEO|nr:hypothetical protein BCR34DRAFT_589423 [Clohesyomyces aquaticus]